MNDNQRALTEREASKYIGFSASFLRQSRCDGKRENHVPPPPFVRLGRTIRYLKEDLDDWLERAKKATVSRGANSNAK